MSERRSWQARRRRGRNTFEGYRGPQEATRFAGREHRHAPSDVDVTEHAVIIGDSGGRGAELQTGATGRALLAAADAAAGKTALSLAGLATTGITGDLTLTKTGTTARQVTFPDAAGTVALLERAQTFSALQTFSAGARFAAGAAGSIGSSADDSFLLLHGSSSSTFGERGAHIVLGGSGGGNANGMSLRGATLFLQGTDGTEIARFTTASPAAPLASQQRFGNGILRLGTQLEVHGTAADSFKTAGGAIFEGSSPADPSTGEVRIGGGDIKAAGKIESFSTGSDSIRTAGGGRLEGNLSVLGGSIFVYRTGADPILSLNRTGGGGGVNIRQSAPDTLSIQNIGGTVIMGEFAPTLVKLAVGTLNISTAAPAAPAAGTANLGPGVLRLGTQLEVHGTAADSFKTAGGADIAGTAKALKLEATSTDADSLKTAGGIVAKRLNLGIYATPVGFTTHHNLNVGGNGIIRAGSNAGDETITGIVAGEEGDVLWVVNIQTNNVILSHESSSSNAANRIVSPTGSNITIPPSQAGGVTLIYFAGRWRLASNASF